MKPNETQHEVLSRLWRRAMEEGIFPGITEFEAAGIRIERGNEAIADCGCNLSRGGTEERPYIKLDCCERHAGEREYTLLSMPNDA